MLIDTYTLSFHFELVTEDSILRRYIVMNILEIIRFQKYGKYRSGPFTSETSWTSVIAIASKTMILFYGVNRNRCHIHKKYAEPTLQLFLFSNTKNCNRSLNHKCNSSPNLRCKYTISVRGLGTLIFVSLLPHVDYFRTFSRLLF